MEISFDLRPYFADFPTLRDWAIIRRNVERYIKQLDPGSMIVGDKVYPALTKEAEVRWRAHRRDIEDFSD